MPTWRSTMPRTDARVRAERHANADLARALRDRVREHAVQSDRGEQRRQQRERRGQRPDHPIEEDVLFHLLRHRLETLDREIRDRAFFIDAGIARSTWSVGSELRT